MGIFSFFCQSPFVNYAFNRCYANKVMMQHRKGWPKTQAEKQPINEAIKKKLTF